MTEWLLAQLFDRVRTAMGVRNCADGCHLLQVLVACRLCHICYDLAQRVDVGFRFCLGSRQELLSHSLQRRLSVHGSVFELRQGLAPDRSGGGTSSVSDTFEDSEALVGYGGWHRLSAYSCYGESYRYSKVCHLPGRCFHPCRSCLQSCRCS